MRTILGLRDHPQTREVPLVAGLSPRRAGAEAALFITVSTALRLFVDQRLDRPPLVCLLPILYTLDGQLRPRRAEW